jgi:serpin B
MSKLRTCLWPLLGLALAACGSNADPDSTPDSDAGTDANQVDPPKVARSDAPRDPASSVPSATLEAIVEADNAFAFDLYAKVRESAGEKNAVMSPLSVSLALSMTYAGAQNATAQEMAKALRFDAPGLDVHAGHNALAQALATRAAEALAAAEKDAQMADSDAPSPEDFRLHVVNSVWGDGSYTWEPPFLDTLAKSYGAGVYLADFLNQYDVERLRINAWVSEETQDKIKDLLPDGSLDDNTRMVLVNAMHLKLPWQNPFRKEATAAGDFAKADGSTVSVDFMAQEESFAYFEDDRAQIVSLPLVGRKVSLVVALPKTDLNSFEAGLDLAYWKTAWASRESAPVSIKLPKFSFTTESIKLKEVFEGLGMVQPFDDEQADFYGMCQSPPRGERLYIAEILHKAMMAVDENGVEAAAATAVIMAGNTSVPPTPISMVVDKPFVVAIVDEPTGSLLFLGRIQDPG